MRPDALLKNMRATVADLPECASTVGYLARCSAASGRQPRLPAMRRALLITAIATAEAILKGIIHRILFNRHGGSWHAPALDTAVDKIMTGGVEKWEERLIREQCPGDVGVCVTIRRRRLAGPGTPSGALGGCLLAVGPLGEVAAVDGGGHQVTERVGGAGEGGDAQRGQGGGHLMVVARCAVVG
jgi:hypothetical protein